MQKLCYVVQASFIALRPELNESIQSSQQIVDAIEYGLELIGLAGVL